MTNFLTNLSITLTQLSVTVGIVSLILTALTYFFARQRINNIILSYLQYFVGLFFIVSGYVKAVDPLGTGYKMKDYFAEFESTFSETAISFITPLFPWMSSHSATIAVAMIVFEIVLGVMLIIGSWRKFTAWAFLLLVALFTVLTGYTYLTAYVPDGVNFFEFSKWGKFVETQMKVTDCGCFGDFMKLKPIVTFSKDVVLLIPGIIFLLASKKMHQLSSPTVRNITPIVLTIGLIAFCMNNYVWDIPKVDFRPFKNGVNIAETKMAEEDAAANAKLLAYKMTNKTTGEVVELPFADYMKQFKNYPSEEWELDQIKEEPAIKATKISDFELSNLEGLGITEELLSDENYSFWAVSYQLKGTESQQTIMVQDTLFRTDTLATQDTILYQQVVDRIEKKQKVVPLYEWDANYLKQWTERAIPLLKQAQSAGMNVHGFTAYSDPERIVSFQEALGMNLPFATGDDIMLKTIVRSNPGILLMKNGKIIQKWHHSKLPTFEEIKTKYMK